jgi:hypothetical protein
MRISLRVNGNYGNKSAIAKLIAANNWEAYLSGAGYEIAGLDMPEDKVLEVLKILVNEPEVIGFGVIKNVK